MSQENVELFKQLVRTWSDGDFSDWMALFSDDVVLTGYMPEGVVTFEGREAVVNYLADFNSMWTTYRVETESVASVNEAAVLVYGRQVGVGRSSGVEIAEPAYNLNLIRDGQIVATHWHVERAKVFEVAGLWE